MTSLSLLLAAGSSCPGERIDQGKILRGASFLPEVKHLILGEATIAVKGETAGLVLEAIANETMDERAERLLRLRLETKSKGIVLWNAFVESPMFMPGKYALGWDEKTQTVALLFLVHMGGNYLLFYEIELDRVSELVRSEKNTMEQSTWFLRGDTDTNTPPIGTSRREVDLTELLRIPRGLQSYLEDATVRLKEGRWVVALTLSEERRREAKTKKELKDEERQLKELQEEDRRLSDKFNELKREDREWKDKERELRDRETELMAKRDELEDKIAWTTSRVHLALPIRKLDAQVVFVSKEPFTNAPARPPR